MVLNYTKINAPKKHQLAAQCNKAQNKNAQYYTIQKYTIL